MKKAIFGLVFTAILLGTVGLSFINSNNGQAFLLGILNSNIDQDSSVSNSNTEIPAETNIWSEDIKITNLTEPAPYHLAAIDSDNNIHLVWDDNRIGNFEIYYKYFDGYSWSSDIQVSNSSGDSYAPSIAIGPDDTVHIAWMEVIEEGIDVYYNSFDGISWSGELRLTNSTYGSSFPYSLSYIEVGVDNRIHLVWDDTRDDPEHEDSEVYYKFFDGNNWSQDYRVTYAPGTSKVYEFEIDQNGNLHIIYTDTRFGSSNKTLFHISYNGIEWSDEFPVVFQSFTPEAAMAIGSDDIVHIEWYNRSGDQDELYYRTYDIENDVWSDIELIDIVTWEHVYPSMSYASLYRNLAVGPDNKLHIAYSDAVTGNTEIYYRVKDENDWSEKIQLTNASGSSVWPAVISTYNNRVYIVWLDNRDGVWALYYKYSPVEVPDPILELMNNILQKLTEIDNIIGTETQGCVKWILNKLSDKALKNINDAIDAYLNEKIHKAKLNVFLIKVGLKISSKIIKIADKLGSIDDDVADDLQNRIENVQNDISLLIQMLSELI